MTRFYLAAVGLLYIGLALWCSFDPATTSRKVGFTLNGDSGQSEFLTVYGGLEFAMGLIFLLPLLRPEATSFSLLSCLLIHGSLVGFRTISFVLYRNISEMTTSLATGEWVILIVTALLYWASRPK